MTTSTKIIDAHVARANMEKAAKRVKSGVVAREWLRADRKGRLLFSKLKK